MPTKAPAYFAAYNWSGFYIGINGGATLKEFLRVSEVIVHAEA